MTTQADELREGLALALLNSDRAMAGFPPIASRANIRDSDGYVVNAQAVAAFVSTYLRANARSLAQHDDTAEAWVEKIIGLIEEAGRG